MKIIADAMLGRLAKWLRFLGFDVAYMRDISDRQLIQAAREEGRTVLTRDSGLLRRKLPGIRMIFLRSNDTAGQLRELNEMLPVDRAPHPPRCTHCNGSLEEAVKDEQLKAAVPDFVYHHWDVFVRCRLCGRIYWEGSHYRHFQETIDALRRP